MPLKDREARKAYHHGRLEVTRAQDRERYKKPEVAAGKKRRATERYHVVVKTSSEKLAAKKARDDRRRAGRMAYLKWYKLHHGCKDCGYREDSDALQFDHVVEKEQGMTVSKLVAAKLSRLLDEVDKCEVRCANCHALVTARRRRGAGEPALA